MKRFFLVLIFCLATFGCSSENSKSPTTRPTTQSAKKKGWISWAGSWFTSKKKREPHALTKEERELQKKIRLAKLRKTLMKLEAETAKAKKPQVQKITTVKQPFSQKAVDFFLDHFNALMLGFGGFFAACGGLFTFLKTRNTREKS